MLIDWEATMTNEERGHATGQHEQPTQQAGLFYGADGRYWHQNADGSRTLHGLPGCCDADVFRTIDPKPTSIGVSYPFAAIDLAEWVAASFEHADRIEILNAEERYCETCMVYYTAAHCPDCYDEAREKLEYALEDAADRASDFDRGC